MKYRDRRDAGLRLAGILKTSSYSEPFVLALPRGGVPVAFEVARALSAPMEIFVARKIGAPHQPEFGIGAIAEGGVHVFDDRTVSRLGLTPAQLQDLAAAAEQELHRRVDSYRGARALPRLAGRDVILVDDGLATGVTAEAALSGLRQHKPRKLILAAPVCAPSTCVRLSQLADEVVCEQRPESFLAVGLWYDDFSQVTDGEVASLMSKVLETRT
ncbi:MAG TPA: phosphoribosyltransferase family protein [Actinomycetota bacterium]|nr:phosphoribosyltransferase family protein [Actinomycetota bacterium]